jgi:flagellar FliL protein
MAKSEPFTLIRLAKAAMAVLLIVGASVGATLFYYSGQTGLGQSNAETPPQAVLAALAAPIFAPLEPFTVALRGQHNSRILYVAITLRVENESSRQMLLEYMPEVRDRVLQKLAGQNPDHVQTPEGRADLVALLRKTIEGPYLPQPQGPDLKAVLFTAFVIQ